MTSLHVICGLGPPQSKILASPMLRVVSNFDYVRKSMIDIAVPYSFICQWVEVLS